MSLQKGSAGHSFGRFGRRFAREEPRFDEPADYVPGGDVKLLDKRGRVRWRAQAQIAERRHGAAAASSKADRGEAAAPRRTQRAQNIRRAPGGRYRDQHVALATEPQNLALEQVLKSVIVADRG